MADLRSVSRQELLAEADRLAKERFAELKSTNQYAQEASRDGVITAYREFFYRFLSRRATVRP
jgi:hypothetical protein